MNFAGRYCLRNPHYESLRLKAEPMEAASHYEALKRLFQEAKLPLEERPRQKWGPNYVKGPVEYNVLRLGGNRIDFLFDAAGSLVAVSR